MKKSSGFLVFLLTASLSCGVLSILPEGQEPSVPTIVANTMQALTTTGPAQTQPPANNPPAFNGMTASYNNINLVIPADVASGINGVQIQPATDPNTAPWDITPGHSELRFNDYRLQGTFLEPKITVYPAQAYAALFPGAADSITRLQAILANPNAPLINDKLPYIPFFNAGAVFIAQAQVIRFQNGSGVRMLTQYAQSFAEVNNHEMFYHFQGLTSDGQAYIIAVLPINAPFLPAEHGAPLPADGVPFPGYDDPNMDFHPYYDAVTNKLNSAPPETFTPTLTALDQMLASLQVLSP